MRHSNTKTALDVNIKLYIYHNKYIQYIINVLDMIELGAHRYRGQGPNYPWSDLQGAEPPGSASLVLKHRFLSQAAQLESPQVLDRTLVIKPLAFSTISK